MPRSPLGEHFVLGLTFGAIIYFFCSIFLVVFLLALSFLLCCGGPVLSVFFCSFVRWFVRSFSLVCVWLFRCFVFLSCSVLVCSAVFLFAGWFPLLALFLCARLCSSLQGGFLYLRVYGNIPREQLCGNAV